MDSDISTVNSKYYQILKARHADLDFVMPQFYNGATRPVLDGVGSAQQGSMSAASIFSLLSNDMFSGKPEKVVFGFCISDCAGSSSNANAAEAAQVMSELKT
jgi:chitinase